MTNTDGIGTADAVYDWTETDPATAVVTTLAATLDSDERDVESLYASIDPDALAAVVRSSPDASVTFRHAGCRVRVSGDGAVAVAPIE